MKIEELKKKGNVTVTEVKNGCVKVSVDEGFILKDNDTYTSEIYCAKDAELQNYEVVSYNDYLLAENRKKYEGKTLEEAKDILLRNIESYDTSTSVNGFMLNGQKVWFDFELRDRVYQGNERLQRIGRTDTTLWLGNQCYNLSIEQAQNIISHIEAYAKDCYNVTAAHKAAVEKMQTLEEVMIYDYTQGYPEQLKMEVSL